MTTALGACIRLYPDGPALHVNDAHSACGVTGAHIGDDGYLWITHAQSRPVVAIVPVPDETLTARGITAGASGGTNYSRVLLAEHGVALDLRDPADYAKVAGSFSNLWYFVLHDGHEPTPRLDRLERVAALLEAGTGWDFNALTLAFPSFDAVRDAHADFDTVAVPR